MNSRDAKGHMITVVALLGILFLIVLWAMRIHKIIGWFQ